MSQETKKLTAEQYINKSIMNPLKAKGRIDVRLETLYELMEEYATLKQLACLEKAAENAIVDSHTPVGRYYPEYYVDKESITSKENLV